MGTSTTPIQPAMQLFIDTDMGVDDAVAVAWLLAQPTLDIVGISTVYGNSSVEAVTSNVLTLLDAADRDIPVTVGAATPLVCKPYLVGPLLHGPDGFWGFQQSHNLSDLSHDAPAAIAAAARANPGLVILALGPMTNLAQAIQAYPDDLANARVIALAGSRNGGNTTPVAEFNAYADPHALDILLSSNLRIELVMRDAFDQLTIDASVFIERLASLGGSVGQLLSRMLVPYAQMSAFGGGGVAVPDAVAAIYALRPDLGTPRSALVQVMTVEGYARGQTIVADTLATRMSLILSADEMSELAQQFVMPGFDLQSAIGGVLQRRLDNAQVLLEVNNSEMLRLLEETLTQPSDKMREVGR